MTDCVCLSPGNEARWDRKTLQAFKKLFFSCPNSSFRNSWNHPGSQPSCFLDKTTFHSIWFILLSLLEHLRISVFINWSSRLSEVNVNTSFPFYTRVSPHFFTSLQGIEYRLQTCYVSFLQLLWRHFFFLFYVLVFGKHMKRNFPLFEGMGSRRRKKFHRIISVQYIKTIFDIPVFVQFVFIFIYIIDFLFVDL